MHIKACKNMAKHGKAWQNRKNSGLRQTNDWTDRHKDKCRC